MKNSPPTPTTKTNAPHAPTGETSEEWSARVRGMTRDERRAAADATCAPLEAAALAVSAGITSAARTVIDPRNGDAVRVMLTRFKPDPRNGDAVRVMLTRLKPGTREHAAPIGGEASVDARASIVAFLTAEAHKFTRAAESAGDKDADAYRRLDSKASILQTMAAYVARGDDRQGGE